MGKTDFNRVNHVVLDALDQTNPRVQQVRELLEDIEGPVQLSLTTWEQDEAIYNLSTALVTLGAIPTEDQQALAFAREVLDSHHRIIDQEFGNLPHTKFIIQMVIDNALHLLDDSAPAQSEQ